MREIRLGTAMDANTAGKLILGGWESHPKLSKAGMAILKRHRFTCRGCGFYSRPSMQVPHGWMLPIDFEHPAMLALDVKKGTCLCPLCASSMAINWSVATTRVSGKEMPAPGMLIMLPHMSQSQLNRLALHVISIHASRKVSTQTSLEIAATNVDNTMRSLNAELQASLPIYRGEQDAEFARALAMLPDEFYSRREEIIGPVRWWPSMRFWREQGAYWMQSTFKDLQHKEPSLVGE